MIFLNPLFLTGIALISAPLIIHFLSNRQPFVINFPTIKYLKKIEETVKTRRRLRDIILLILRILTIFFLAIAFSRPVVEKNYIPALNKNKASHYVILLDVSASMGYHTGKETFLERAKNIICKIQKNMNSNDIISLIIFSDKSEVKAEKILKNIDISDVLKNIITDTYHNDYQKAFLRADRLFIESGDYNNILCLISDMQKTAFDRLKKSGVFTFETPEIHLKLIPVNQDNVYNNYIIGAEPARTVFYKNKKVEIKLFTGISDNKFLKPFNASIFCDNKKISESLIEKTEQSIRFEINGTGGKKIKITLAKDPLEFDNCVEFNINIIEAARIALFSQGAENSEIFLEKALNPYNKNETSKNNFLVTSRDINRDFDFRNKFDAVIWDKINSFGNSQVEAAANFVNNGGCLIIFPDNNANIQLYNALLQKKYGLLKFQIVEKKYNLTSLSVNDNLCNIVNYNPQALQHIEFNSYYTFSDLKDGKTLCMYQNGTPFIIENRYGQGNVFFINLVNDKKNSLMVLSSFYPIFVNQLLYYIFENSMKKVKKVTKKELNTGESVLKYYSEKEINGLIKTKSIAESRNSVNDVVTKNERDKKKIWKYLFFAILILSLVEYTAARVK